MRNLILLVLVFSTLSALGQTVCHKAQKIIDEGVISEANTLDSVKGETYYYSGNLIADRSRNSIALMGTIDEYNPKSEKAYFKQFSKLEKDDDGDYVMWINNDFWVLNITKTCVIVMVFIDAK